MQLILHIGEGKTGTTSIQKNLLNNKELLLKSGILCHMNHHQDHLRLAYAVGKTTRAPQQQHANLKAKALKLLQEIKELALSYKVKYILISSESFFSLKAQQQKCLISSLGLNFEAIKVLVYIRNPADLYLSLMQQRIKADHTIVDPLRYERDIFTPLKRWYKFVGKGNMILRAFNKRNLIDGDVVRDFYKALESFTGKNYNTLANSPNNDNTSLSSEQAIVVQKYRSDFLAEYKGSNNPKSTRLLKFYQELKDYSVDALPMTKPKLRPELYSVISKNNEKFIKSIDELFGTDFLNIFQISTDFTECKSLKGPYTDIAQIFESYNEQTLNFLFLLIPAYNEAVKSSNAQSSLHSLVLENPFLGLCYSKYLLFEGVEYKLISKYILKQSFKKAIELGVLDEESYDHFGKFLRECLKSQK